MESLSINPDPDIREIRKEYESLKRSAQEKIDPDVYVMCVVHILFTVTVAVVVAVQSQSIFFTVLAALAYGFYFGLFVTGIVSAIINFFVGERLTKYLEARRLSQSWYQRFIYLEPLVTEFDKAEKIRQAEARRLRLLPLQNAVDEIREQLNVWDLQVSDIDELLRRKKKWYGEYRELEDSIELCQDDLDYLKSEADSLQIEFADLAKEAPFLVPWLVDSIKRVRHKCESLLEKMQSMRDWAPPVRTTSRSLTDRGTGVTRRPRIGTSRETRPTIAQSEDSSDEYDFSQPETIKQPIVVAPPSPPKRRVLNRQLKKIPFEDYVGAAKAKMTIGELGEIIVLHYEIRRVEEESSRNSSRQVSRVSEDSNSLGYDIESFLQGEKVFIEVKSTTGTFWTDFYLTANERNVMKALGEKYWLYRIFELSKEDGSAKLSVFRGKSSIEASFELEAMNFKMNPKAGTITDGTLPFETVE